MQSANLELVGGRNGDGWVGGCQGAAGGQGGRWFVNIDDEAGRIAAIYPGRLVFEHSANFLGVQVSGVDRKLIHLSEQYLAVSPVVPAQHQHDGMGRGRTASGADRQLLVQRPVEVEIDEMVCVVIGQGHVVPRPGQDLVDARRQGEWKRHTGAEVDPAVAANGYVVEGFRKGIVLPDELLSQAIRLHPGHVRPIGVNGSWRAGEKIKSVPIAAYRPVLLAILIEDRTEAA